MKLIIAIILLAASTINSYANELLKSKHTFNAKVANVRLNDLLISQGKKSTDQISVSLPAVIFAQPMHIQDVRTFTTKIPIVEINALIRYSKANIEGSVQDIVSFWSPDERAKKSELLARPEISKANREYSLKNPNLLILGVVYQSGSNSILLKRDNRVIGVTFHMKNNQIFLTDKPSNDLELAIIEASYSIE